MPCMLTYNKNQTRRALGRAQKCITATGVADQIIWVNLFLRSWLWCRRLLTSHSLSQQNTSKTWGGLAFRHDLQCILSTRVSNKYAIFIFAITSVTVDWFHNFFTVKLRKDLYRKAELKLLPTSSNLSGQLYSFTFILVRIICFMSGRPHAGSRVVRIDLLHFLAGCHKRWLNQALSVFSLSLGFF